jgi:hypothetical protein
VAGFYCIVHLSVRPSVRPYLCPIHSEQDFLNVEKFYLLGYNAAWAGMFTDVSVEHISSIFVSKALFGTIIIIILPSLSHRNSFAQEHSRFLGPYTHIPFLLSHHANTGFVPRNRLRPLHFRSFLTNLTLYSSATDSVGSPCSRLFTFVLVRESYCGYRYRHLSVIIITKMKYVLRLSPVRAVSLLITFDWRTKFYGTNKNRRTYDV